MDGNILITIMIGVVIFGTLFVSDLLRIGIKVAIHLLAAYGAYCVYTNYLL